MARAHYEVAYMAVVSSISSTVAGFVSNSSSDVGEAQLAEIERLVAIGDRSFRAGLYEAALRSYRKARSLIYRLQRPDFDAGAFELQPNVMLPVGKAVENKLFEVSGQMSGLVRPVVGEPQLRFVQDGPVPDDMTPFLKSGYREKFAADALAEDASVQAVTLMQENKADVAVMVLQNALQDIGDQRADPSVTGALRLNLASALLQSGDADGALGAGKQAQQDFAGAEDLVGQAQATHVQAMALDRAGQSDDAAQLFDSAAALLKKAGGNAPEPGPTRGDTTVSPLRPTRADPVRVHTLTSAHTLSPVAMSAPAALAANTALTRPAAMAFAPLGGARAGPVEALVDRDLGSLSQIAAKESDAISFRIPGRAAGWGSYKLPDAEVQKQQQKAWTIGVLANGGLKEFALDTGTPTSGDLIAREIYEPRILAEAANALEFVLAGPRNTMFFLTHLYAYALPVKIGDCHHELGQYALAERYYLQAAEYSYLNSSIEAVALWIRLARNAVEWGDALYKQEDLPGAAAHYSRLVMEDGTVPAGSNLYAPASLASATAQARTLIENIRTRPLPSVDWEIAISVLTAFSRLQQIADNLDFYGLALSPIHTFEYLQSVARGFTQESIQAEREFVNFKMRQEGEEATRHDLEAAIAMARAEADAKLELFRAAQQDVQAADAALDLAVTRHAHAQQQRSDYAASSSSQIWAQAAATALGMGEDALYGEISELADKLARGETLSGPAGLLAAAVTLYAGRKTRQYELEKMDDNIAELAQAITIAQEQLQSAQNRAAAAEILWQAAEQKVALTAGALDAFDNEFFTPEAWEKMSNVMRSIARSYLYRAIRIAKLMERAYNFDNDTDYKIIKNQYGYALGNAEGQAAKLLGGDSLLVDVESFTYIAITSKTRKNSRIKDSISMAAQFPAQFEEFKRTGLLGIETDLYEFDRLHPGYYGQRIEAVEIEIVGLLPQGGLNGTITAGGVTAFRKKDGTLGKRVHQVDTMALSGFLVRADAFLYSTETGVRGLFQGMGLGSTWQLHLPKRSNDFDFNRIFDVNLVFYYTATFDKHLRTQVLAAPARADETRLLRTLQLRYDFPDAWYVFYRDGAVTFDLDRARLPANQTNFAIEAAHFRLITRPGVSPEGVELFIIGPDGSEATLVTDAEGVVTSEGTALDAMHGSDPVGTWRVEVVSGDSLMQDGELKLDRVYNLQLGLEYSFDLPAEVL